MRCLLFLLLGLTTGAGAQPAPGPASALPDAYWQWTAAGTGAAPALSPANEVIIQQAGSGNQALMAVLNGSQNRVQLNQTASGNTASVQLTGQANQLMLTQAGGGNVLTLGLTGSTNRLRIDQNGGDVVQLAGLTGSHAGIDLIQRGGNNTIVADGLTVPSPASSGQGVANLRIEQSGGATIRIQNGPTPER